MFHKSIADLNLPKSEIEKMEAMSPEKKWQLVQEAQQKARFLPTPLKM